MMRKLKAIRKEDERYSKSYAPSMFCTEEEVSELAFIHRKKQVLSDTPYGSNYNNYPYQTISDGVMLHPVFKSLFPEGRIPVMTKQRADRLFATEFGFDKKTGYPCRILKKVKQLEIMVYPPNDTPYVMDCFTGLKKEK